MSDLLTMEATATHTEPQCFQPATAAWQQALAAQPDKAFARYILSGMRHGFLIGADRTCLSLRPGPGNFPSVLQHPDLVKAHIAAEIEEGRLMGPVPGHLVPLCHCSPIGLIPKPHQPGRWPLIVDLSSPKGHSVNDAISPQVAHMNYASVLDAAELIRLLGPGTLMAKVDLQNAYRVLPVHADDHPLLAIKWGPAIYLDTTLPFGLHSAPNIFSAFADALAWVMHSNGICQQLHYLEDFLFLGAASTHDCAASLQTALQVCQRLGVPVAAHKTEGPSTCLTFLAIQIDSVAMQLSLPPDKLSRIRGLVLS